MGLELDTLKNNNQVSVIYNNSTGQIVEFFGGDDFIMKMWVEFRIKAEHIQNYFSAEEIEDFFIDNDIHFGELRWLLE
jgi:hypothetical protein